MCVEGEEGRGEPTDAPVLLQERSSPRAHVSFYWESLEPATVGTVFSCGS